MPLQITPFTTTPSRANPATFSADMDIRLNQENSRIVEMNLQSAENNAINNNVNIKEASVLISAASAAESSLSAQGSANYQGAWTSKGYTLGQTVSDANGVRWLCKLTHTTAQSASEGTYWTIAIPYVGAIGNINSPLLDMPLKNSLAMKSGVGSATFTRASTATYIDRYGVLKTASVDEPRFEKEGYLNEGSITNLLTYSEQFDNAVWIKSGVTATSNTVDTIDPYGTNVADVLLSTATTAWHQFSPASITITSGTTYSMSIFAKAGTFSTLQIVPNGTNFGTGYANFNLTDGTISAQSGLTNASITPLSNGWYRCTVVAIAIATGTGAVYYSIQNSPTAARAASYLGAITDSIYIFGAQLEELPFATSYIPTVASTVTRSADVLSVTPYNNFGYADNTILMSFDSNSNNKILLELGSVVSDRLYLFIDTLNNLEVGSRYDSGSTFTAEVPYVLGSKIRVGVVTTSTYNYLYVNGVLVASKSRTSGAPFKSLGYIKIGYSITAGYTAYAHISNIQLHGKALTAQEVALA